jgi:hypothetical protein
MRHYYSLLAALALVALLGARLQIVHFEDCTSVLVKVWYESDGAHWEIIEHLDSVDCNGNE